MTDFMTDEEFPNLPEDGKRKLGKVYVEDTKGLRVRKNRSDDAIEIWVDGQYVAGWAGADKIEVRLQTMLRFAYEAGLANGVKRNQKALRDALGLELV